MEISWKILLPLTISASALYIVLFIYLYEEGSYFPKQVILGHSKMNITKSKEGNLCIYIPKIGRLGNHISLYAVAYGLEKYYGRKVLFNPAYNDLFKLFQNLRCSIVQTKPKWKSVYHRYLGFYKDLLHLPERNYTISGFPFSYKYFEQYNKELYKLFKFKEMYVNQTNDFLNKIKSTYRRKSKKNNSLEVITVAIHIRRGDKVVSKYHQLPEVGDLMFAMDFMRNKLGKNIIFIAASDDKKWVEHNLKNEDIFISPLTSPELDLALLASCDHAIISQGTFSWWVAWFVDQRYQTNTESVQHLKNKIVQISKPYILFYQHPFRKYAPQLEIYRREDIYPGLWMAYSLRDSKSNGA